MSIKLIVKVVPVGLLLFCSFMVSSSTAAVPTDIQEMPLSVAQTPHPTQTNNEEKVLEGMVLGRSTKAQIITVVLDDKVEILKFNAQTKGIKFATKSSNVIIKYSTVGTAKIATSVTPKLAVLPMGVEEIDLDELVDLVNTAKQDNYLLIDARPRSKYALGHIPSALSLPLIEQQNNRSGLANLGAKGKKLIFYSDGTTCSLCTKAAQLAASRGFSDIKVLLPGIQGWEDENEILTLSDSLIISSNHILIDIRPQDQVNSGHIAGAVNISLDDLTGDEIEYEFPADRSAPLVFYGSKESVATAAEIVTGWGYRNIRKVDGGFDGWLARDQEMSTGPLPGPEGISWTKNTNKNQVSKKNFKKMVLSSTPEAIILDVRTNKETQRGRIKNSLHIPLEELAARRLEIPTDREVFTHCATGARAEMATIFLSQYRDDVRFLSAKVRCKGEKCGIK